MELFYIIISGIVSIFSVLSLGRLLRLIVLKKLYPDATIKDIENFERKTKRKYFRAIKRNEN